MRYYFIHTRMVIIKIITGIGEDVEKLEPSYWWECKMVQSLWKIVWQILKHVKIELLLSFRH